MIGVLYCSHIEIEIHVIGHHFAADLFKCTSVKEILCILMQISLNLVVKGPNDNM